MGQDQPHSRSLPPSRICLNAHSRSGLLTFFIPTFAILILFIFNIHHIHFLVFLVMILFSSSRSSFTLFLFQIEKLRVEFESCYPALCSATGSVISAIQKWRQNFERTLPFMWRDQDYMVRMLGQVKQNPRAHDHDVSPYLARQHLVVHGSDVALSLGYSLLGRWAKH